MATPVLKSGPVMKTPAASAAPQAVCRPLVKPNPDEAKRGCLFCPLMCYSADFPRYASQYQRDAAKIKSREKEPHTVRSRNISETWTKVDVLFIGEAPGNVEDCQGTPFVGRSGKLLRAAVQDTVRLPPSKIGFSNTIRCRPPRNRDPGKTEVRSCCTELLREIEARQPKLLVVLGNHSLDFLCGQTGITTLTGKLLRCTAPGLEAMRAVACLHPAYILRFDHELERFLAALRLANDYLRGSYKELPGAGEYEVLSSVPAVVKLMQRFRSQKKLVAFDTETGGLSPFQTKYPRLLCFSFSDEEGKGYVVPLDHPGSPWHKDSPNPVAAADRGQIMECMRKFFTDASVPKIGQNEKFDRQHIFQALGAEPENVVGDTMLLHQVLDERRGTHGLKMLAYSYTGMGGYEKPLDDYCASHKDADFDKGGSYANVPAEVLFPYAAMDADVTLRCWNAMQREEAYRGNVKFQALAETFLPALSHTLAHMEYNGATVDPAIVALLDTKYSKEMELHTAEIAKLPKVREFVLKRRSEKEDPAFTFNPGSAKQLSTVLFDHYKLAPLELTEGGFDRLVARHKRLSDEAVATKKPKPSFTSVVQAAVHRREWEHFTTKADVLHEYERQGNDLCGTLLKYREAQTLHGTFVVPLKTLLDESCRVHGTFHIGGTITGRLASSDPNLQNISNKDGGLIKRAYVSRFGKRGYILNVDFSQIELRVAAAYFNEPTMIEAYRKGEDLHTLTAAAIAFPQYRSDPARQMAEYKKLSKADQKEWRSRAKRTNFGTIYGIGPDGLVSTLKKDGVFITRQEAEKLIETYFEVRPALRRGMDTLEARVKKFGYLESLTGRWRRVPEVFSEDQSIVGHALRQSVNFPIQNGAADMTLMALVLIEKLMCEEGYESLPILTVHDSIVFDCTEDEVMDVAATAKEIMERIPELSEEVLPGLDWKWLRGVPLVAECEAGPTWGQMVEFDPGPILRGEPAPKTPYIGKTDKNKDDLLRKAFTLDEFKRGCAFKVKQGA